MAKIRLTAGKRELIRDYMTKKYDEKYAGSDADARFQVMLIQANNIIRGRYPEKDMSVLRKYNLTRHDPCLRFSVEATGRVFAIEVYNDDRSSLFADMPSERGCRSNDVFAADEVFATLFDEWELAEKDKMNARRKAISSYIAFIDASRTVEDVEAVIALPPELRERIGAASNGVVALNTETLAQIRTDFAEAA